MGFRDVGLRGGYSIMTKKLIFGLLFIPSHVVERSSGIQ